MKTVKSFFLCIGLLVVLVLSASSISNGQPHRGGKWQPQENDNRRNPPTGSNDCDNTKRTDSGGLGSSNKTGDINNSGCEDSTGGGSGTGSGSNIGSGAAAVAGDDSTVGSGSNIGGDSATENGSTTENSSTIGDGSTAGSGSTIGNGSTVGSGSTKGGFGDVSVYEAPAATPEPISMLLFGTGLVGIGFAARRRLRGEK